MLIFWVAMPALAVEDLRGWLILVDPADGTLYGSAHDVNNLTDNTFRVLVCWDDPTFTSNCDQPVLANTSNFPGSSCAGSSCVGFHYLAPTGSVGSVVPRDGNQHFMYARIISNANPGAGDREIDGSPWPFQIKSGVVGPMWSANLEATPTRLAAAQLAILANSQDPYSVGRNGNVICNIGGVLVRDDGVAGYYAMRRQVPCANVAIVSVPVAQVLRQNTFYSSIVPVLQGLPPSLQAIAIAWVQPSIVAFTSSAYWPQSISAAVANAGLVTGTGCYSGPTLPFLGQGPINPYFNSPSEAPFTDYQIRPAMMLVGETCPTCQATNNYAYPWVEDFPTAKSMIDSAIAATDSNPQGGNVDWSITSNLTTSETSYLVSALELGNGLSLYTNSQILGSRSNPASSTVSAQNILLYEESAANWTYFSPTFVAGAGIGYAVTSTSGALPSDGNQTTAASWLSQGAVGAFGNAVEPCELLTYKHPDPALVIPNYTQGQTLVEALWKSVRLPWGGNFLGDPLAAPFSLQNGHAPSGPVLNSISPASVPSGTSLTVTLTGQNFAAPASIAVQGLGITVSGVSVISATKITATFAVSASTVPGSYSVSVTTSGGVSGGVPLQISSGVPVLKSVSPSSGAAGSSVGVTMTGANFAAPATVAVQGQGITVSGVTLIGPTTVTATFALAANAAPGSYSVSLMTPAGTTGNVPFQVSSVGSRVPVLTSLSPPNGVVGSAVHVTLTGTGFTAATSLRLSGPGASIGGSAVVVSSTQITATFTLSATAVLGVHNVYVVDPAGTSDILPFTVNSSASGPVFTSITPSAGTPGTAVNVTLAGSNFISGASLSIIGSGVTASNVTVVSSTRITATLTVAGNAAPGSYPVSVTTTGGSSGTMPFVVTAASPVLTSLSPASGVAGTSIGVTLAGSNFATGASINISGSGVTASNVVVVNGSQITATLVIAANAASGSYSVGVVMSSGSSGTMPFIVSAAPPILTSLSPASGVAGTSIGVTLAGSNFATGASINISGSGVTASNVVVVNSSQITSTLVIAPNAAPGSYSVGVVTSSGSSGAMPFIVSAAPPILTSLSPASGVAGTSIGVTLAGSNFATGASINISGAGVTASNVVVVNGSQITATLMIAANALSGSYPVAVTTTGGSSGMVPFTVSLTSPPVLTSLTPASGVAGTSTSVTLSGSNFAAGSAISISGSGLTAASVAVVNSSQITAALVISANAAPGPHGVQVTGTNGSTGQLTFTVNPANGLPTVTSVTPATGARGTAVAVTITGTNFISGAGLRLSGLGASINRSDVVVNQNTITATFTLTPTAVLGVHNVYVVTSAGTSNTVPFVVY